MSKNDIKTRHVNTKHSVVVSRYSSEEINDLIELQKLVSAISDCKRFLLLKSYDFLFFKKTICTKRKIIVLDNEKDWFDYSACIYEYDTKIDIVKKILSEKV